MGFTAFFEPIAKEFGWSYTQISIAASLRGLELGIFAPLMGFLVDRFGARKLIFCGTLSIGCSFMLLSLMNSLSMFYVSFIIMGLGTSACTGVVLTPAVANWFKRDLGKALGIMASGFGLGGLLIPVITYLINVYQWRTTFVILGAGIWVLGVPVSLLVRQNPEQYGYLPDGANPDASALPTQSQDTEVDFKKALQTKIFWYISIAEAIRLMALMAVITHVMPYLSTLGMPRSKAALVTTCIPLISIIGRVGFGWLGDRFNRWNIMITAYFLPGLGLIAFAYLGADWLIVLFLILFPLTWGAGPVRGAIMRSYFGRASLGKIIGIMAGIGTLARMSGPFLAGWTYDTFGYYQPIWLVFAGTFTISVALMLTLKPRIKHPG